MNISRLKQNPKALAALGLVAALLLAVVIGLMTTKQDEQKSVEQTSTTPVTAVINVTATGFEPAVLTVRTGTKVIWTNKDSSTHQVVSNPHPTHESVSDLKSEILNNDQTYEYTATKSGTIGYHDEINPTINGTLEVQD